MKPLLTVSAILEVGAGLALLGFPSAAASLLFGAPLDSPAAMSVARVGGAGLLALGIACWLARADAHGAAARGVVIAMLFYNVTVVGVLARASFGYGSHNVLLWSVVALHTAMAAWCIANLLRTDEEVL
jgi:hypothetical protein